MRIVCDTKFKDTVDGIPVTFEKGDICSVPERDGARFLGHGWAHEAGSDAPSGDGSQAPVDLDVQNGVLGSKSTL